MPKKIKLKVVYIIAPYRAPNLYLIGMGIERVRKNIERAREMALEVFDRGGVALCPHLNTAEFDFYDRGHDPRTWLDAGLELASRCDAGYADQNSMTEGMKAEIALMKKLGKPVFYGTGPLADYLRTPKPRKKGGKNEP